MIRIVLDTNVFISALLSAYSAPAVVFGMTQDGSVRLCMTDSIFAEYDEVIRRPRFHRADAEIELALRSVRQNAIWMQIVEPIRQSPDPDDDIFLECAQAANAEFLVTGNLKHFPKRWGDTRIVSPRQFLEITKA